VQNGLFISATFVGMTLGALLAGFLGDRYGRRLTYQGNLVLFGAAAIVSALAPNMQILIVLRFLMGLGSGAETVVGYSIITEFFPAAVRGRWSGMIATTVTAGLPVSALLAWILVPPFGWRVMFLLGGVGALIAWHVRRGLPESPRWLESVGRVAEAEALISQIEADAAQNGPLPELRAAPRASAPTSLIALFRAPLRSHLAIGCVCLMTVNTLIYGFVTWVPTFLVGQGLSITASIGFAVLMALGGPVGSTFGAASADIFGRRSTIIGSAMCAIILSAAFAVSNNPLLTPVMGFLLTVPVYVLVAVLFAIYIPELFPTEYRLRGVGICNGAGRSASIVVPLFVGPLFAAYGVAGVLMLMVSSLVAMVVTIALFGSESRRELPSIAPGEKGAAGAVGARCP